MTTRRKNLRQGGAPTLAELIQGVLNSQYASIHPDGLFDLPLQMPDLLPITSLDVDDGGITLSDDPEDEWG